MPKKTVYTKEQLDEAAHNMADYMIELSRQKQFGIANVTYLKLPGLCPVLHSSNGCHASMGYDHTKTSPILGNLVVPRWRDGSFDDSVAYDFFNFITGPKSPYNPLFKFLGSDYCIVKDEDKPVGVMVINPQRVNSKVLMNFFKSFRALSEHYREFLPFWEKWKIKNGAPGGLVYLMGHKFTPDGKHKDLHHAPIESGYSYRLEKFLNPDHTLWALDQSPFSSNNYVGENQYTWGGGKFEPHNIKRADIPKGATETKFYKLYFVEPNGKHTDADLAQFFKNPEAYI